MLSTSLLEGELVKRNVCLRTDNIPHVLGHYTENFMRIGSKRMDSTHDSCSGIRSIATVSH